MNGWPKKLRICWVKGGAIALIKRVSIKLGQKARDKVTGFEGILTGKAEYLYGCAQYCIVPAAKDGKIGESHWFDEGRIEVIGPGLLPEEVQAEMPGGPNRDCPTNRY